MLHRGSTQFLANVQHQTTPSRKSDFRSRCHGFTRANLGRRLSLQAQMFREVATVGTLSMQLVYYRGVPGYGRRMQSLTAGSTIPWNSPASCPKSSATPAKPRSHASSPMAREEAPNDKINALVFVGDACEEERDLLGQGCHRARQARCSRLHFPGRIRSVAQSASRRSPG